MKKVTSGFTLVELLIVIAILALLVELILSVFFMTLEKGRQTACISNLKQIGTAFIMYAHDHEGYFPPYRAFVRYEVPGLVAEVCGGGLDPSFPSVYAPWLVIGSLYPYSKSYEIWFCPSDPYAHTDSYFWCIPHQYLSYYINVRIPWKMSVDGYVRSDGSILPASNFMLARDANDYSLEDLSHLPPTHRPFFDAPGCKHFEGVNLLYLDNHVEWRRNP